MTLDKTGGLTPALQTYLHKHNNEHPALLGLREETQGLEKAFWQIPPEQGGLMLLLTKLMGAKKAIEVGVYTGYSTLAVALGLPEDGKIVACDIDDEPITIGRKYWQQAGVESKIDFRKGPAIDTLNDLLASGEAETYDLVFIDADKKSYGDYYEKALQLLRPGGAILLDNVFWHGGRVVDPEWQDEDTLAIRELNDKTAADSRVEQVMLPLSDGITLIRKR